MPKPREEVFADGDAVEVNTVLGWLPGVVVRSPSRPNVVHCRLITRGGEIHTVRCSDMDNGIRRYKAVYDV